MWLANDTLVIHDANDMLKVHEDRADVMHPRIFNVRHVFVVVVRDLEGV